MVKIIAVAGSKTQTMGVAAFQASFLSSMTDGHFVNVDGACTYSRIWLQKKLVYSVNCCVR